MTLLSFLHYADFVSTVAVDVAVLCFAFPAYRRTKMRAFAYLIWGSVIGIILASGDRFHLPFLSTDDARTYLQFYRFGYLIANILWGVGVVQLIQFVLKKIEQRTPMPFNEKTNDANLDV